MSSINQINYSSTSTPRVRVWTWSRLCRCWVSCPPSQRSGYQIWTCKLLFSYRGNVFLSIILLRWNNLTLIWSWQFNWQHLIVQKSVVIIPASIFFPSDMAGGGGGALEITLKPYSPSINQTSNQSRLSSGRTRQSLRTWRNCSSRWRRRSGT